MTGGLRLAERSAIIQGKFYRFTIINEWLLRMEYSETGCFENRPTQIIKNRPIENSQFEVKESEEIVEIITSAFHLVYTKEKPFSPKTLHIDVRYNFSNYQNRWYYGQPIETLKGTLRTLDRVDGSAELEEGLLSKVGFATLDDSESFVFNEDNTIDVKEETHTDVYFFSYGRQYRKALQAFYTLSDFPPLIPRYALGNWWSRYWKYTEDSYLKLMDTFKKEAIPLSVSVIDMDWHLTDIPSKYGSGWTGYTWNKDYFPEPERFLKELHDKGLSVTLNVHPADGIRAFEDYYLAVAERLNLNTEMEEPAQFDLMDNQFREAYFEDVHHVLEEQGVDFWWIDWQQGEFSRSDIDPLWLLNHYHFEDLKNRGKKPLILSRYAGPGSHRYPVGFSGDTVTSWESLRFQPYLTATSSNIGYTWWSHDIGGHYKGVKDEELILRWIQYGVFSPINRLHSANSAFSSKEPWLFSEPINKTMSEFLRLRHALIPYLYTANVLTHEQGRALIEPIYYEYPFDEIAYDIKNEYFFGSELLVLPITDKKDEETLYGNELLYLPSGQWFDVFTNFRYSGETKLRIYREETTIPVFAKEGSIIPLDAKPTETNANELPTALEWHIYPGKSNSYTLIEDLGSERSETQVELDADKQTLTLSNNDVKGIIPKQREHIIHFNASKRVHLNDLKHAELEDCHFDSELNRTTVKLVQEDDSKDVQLSYNSFKIIEKQDISKELFRRLNIAQIRYRLKDELFTAFNSGLSDLSLTSMLNELSEKNLKYSLFELIYIKNS